jgi:hypothetical protein
MEKEIFINKTLDIISEVTDEQNLIKDWETGSLEIKFRDSNNKSCEIRVCSNFFGLFNTINFSINLQWVAEYEISRKEFKLIKNSFEQRITDIKSSKLNEFFKQENRDNKINQLIN